MATVVAPASGKSLFANIDEFRLANGLRVYVLEERSVPLVAVSLAYHSGPNVEGPGRWGLAHLLEHTMLDGTLHISAASEHRLLGDIGAIEDGGTDLDYVGFWALAPAHEIESLLWLYSDRMGFLGPSLTAERVAKDVAIVLNERRQKENAPHVVATEKIIQQLFPSPHPYYGNIIGSERDIKSITADALRDFHESHFYPANATLVVVGACSPDQIRRLVRRYFGDFRNPPTHPAPSKLLGPARPPNATRLKISTHASQASLSFGWSVCPAYAPDHVPLELLAELLGGSPRSILQRVLVQETQLAHKASCSLWPNRAGSLFQCDIVATAAVQHDKIEALAGRIIEDIRLNGPSAADLTKARRQLSLRLLLDAERLVDRAKKLNHYIVFTGDFAFAKKHFRTIDATHGYHVQRSAKRWLSPHSTVFVHFEPGDEK